VTGHGVRSWVDSLTRDASGCPSWVRYRIVQSGWLTDLDGVASVRLPLGALERISVHLDRGNVRVRDETQGRAATTGRVTATSIGAAPER